MTWNERSREENVSRTALGYTITYVVNTLLQFAYRTIFIRVFASEYLGIEGLFSNIIQLLSFAELGIGSSIAYRLYKPIENRDSKLVAEYMYLYKWGYRLIACVVATIGLLLIPFLKYIIKDTNDIPPDVNLVIVYVIFLFQSVTSYFFIYKQTILAADQRGDVQAKYNCVGKLFTYAIKIAVLIISRNYTLVLIAAIVAEVFSNYVISKLINKMYRQIFIVKAHFNKQLIGGIQGDIKAILCHRVGSTVLNSTDNIVMSKYIGLSILGVYSNYNLIVISVKNLMYQALGNFNGSIGNAHVALDCTERFHLYKKLHFINLWLASVITVTLFSVLSPFIGWWQGNSILLDDATLVAIIISFYMNVARCVDISYTNAAGLFRKDLWRPVLGAVINIVISIYLAKNIGVAGIVWGTIISQLLTVWWRESYLIYRYEFNRNTLEFWLCYFKFALITFLECFIIAKFVEIGSSLASICVCALTVFICANSVMVLVNLGNKEFYWMVNYYKKCVGKISRKMFSKSSKGDV